MSFKSKTVGIIAGTALACSIASGAMAQNDVSVTLFDNTTNGGCSATMAGKFLLGEWRWTGFQYEVTPGTEFNTLQANVRQTVSESEVDCYVTVATDTPLTWENGGETLPMYFNAAGGGDATATVVTETGAGNYINIGVTTGNLGDKPAGVYEGVVSVTASASDI